jgi:hypothetical protein
MILVAMAAYASGRTGVALPGQTIMITLGLPVGSTSWMEQFIACGDGAAGEFDSGG